VQTLGLFPDCRPTEPVKFRRLSRCRRSPSARRGRRFPSFSQFLRSGGCNILRSRLGHTYKPDFRISWGSSYSSFLLFPSSIRSGVMPDGSTALLKATLRQKESDKT
jgi:hypothetical protein